MYFTIYLFFSLLAVFEVIISKSRKNYFALFSLLIFLLILFVGLRNKVGFDYFSYLEMYQFNTDIWFNAIVEPSFSCLVIFFNHFNLGFQSLLLFFAFWAISIKGIFIFKYSPYIFLSLAVYVPIGLLMSDMGQIRHGLALALILIAFHFLFEDKVKLFFLFSLLATLIHTSALIVFPFYFIYKKRPSNIVLLASIAIAFVFVFMDLKMLLFHNSSFLPPIVADKVIFYTNSEDYGKTLGINLSLIIRLSVLGLLLYFEKTATQVKNYRTIILLYFYGILLYLVFNSISDFAIRSSLYFKILELIIFPLFVSFGRLWYDKLLIFVIVFLYAGWSVLNFFSDPQVSHQYIPYKSILF